MGRQEEETSRYDQPDRLDWDEDALDKLEAMRDKPRSKKHRKKSRSLREMAFETQQAPQTVMRHEMERGVHQPERLADTFTGLFGRPQATSPEDIVVEQEALAIIHEWGAGIQTGFREWDIIQDLVERGLRRGYAIGREGAASDRG